eukprot:m.220574 g.220574  ORF g.220574 m.220574 type:complete len:182 (-) comp10406_c0_seq1:142-687(-)
MVRVRKIALLGFPAVGKSSLAQQFVRKKFSDEYCTTIENHMVTNVKLQGGQEFQVHLYDTMGVTEQPNFPDEYLLMDGWVLVFSVIERRSFDVVQDIFHKLRDSGAQRQPIILVGNKSDLTTERQIPTAEAERIAKEFGALYIESSAKDNLHVSDIFSKLILEIEKSSGEAPPKDGDCAIL